MGGGGWGVGRRGGGVGKPKNIGFVGRDVRHTNIFIVFSISTIILAPTQGIKSGNVHKSHRR